MCVRLCVYIDIHLEQHLYTHTHTHATHTRARTHLPAGALHVAADEHDGLKSPGHNTAQLIDVALLHTALHCVSLARASLSVGEDAEPVPIHHALQQRLYFAEDARLRRVVHQHFVTHYLI